MPLSSLFATTILALALTGVEEPAVGEIDPGAESRPHLVYAVEGQYRATRIDLKEAFEAPQVFLAEAPAYGQYFAQPWPFFGYQPAAGFVGRDHLRLEIQDPASGTRLVDYDITVLPERLPVAGHFAGDQELWPGLYDSEDRRLQRCNDVLPWQHPPDSDRYVPLVCHWTKVKGVPRGGIALAVPTGFDWNDRLAIFAPATGTLYWLAEAGGELVVVAQVELPETRGSLPVVGDFMPGWIGRELAFVGREGQVRLLGKGGELVSWAERVDPAVGGELHWPVRWNVGDGDGLALLDPVAGHASWWSANKPTNSLACCFENAVPFDSRLPFWTFDSSDLSGFSVAVLVKTTEGRFVRENLLGLWGIRPTTYPLKFPDDPPGP